MPKVEASLPPAPINCLTNGTPVPQGCRAPETIACPKGSGVVSNRGESQ
jgi:hypothetical protein